MPKLVKMFTVIRHGDRSPAVNVFQSKSVTTTSSRHAIAVPHSSLAELETSAWMSRILEDKAMNSLLNKYPTVDAQETLYAKSNSYSHTGAPFGTLTVKGIDQLFSLGSKFASNPKYQHLLSKKILEDTDNVYIRSTSYDRTKLSMVSFLDGVRGDPHPAGYQIVKGNGKAEKQEARINTSPSGNSESSQKPIKIHVIPRNQYDSLNAWESLFDLRDQVEKFSEKNEHFIRREKEMADVRKEIIDKTPLWRDEIAPFHWVWAADYFKCRESHSDHDIIRENLLPISHLKDATMDHTCRVFLSLFNDPVICRLAIGGLMSEVITHFTGKPMAEEEEKRKWVKRQTNSSNQRNHNVVLCAAHDITILPALAALSALPFHPEEVDKTTSKESWPPYASYLSFEMFDDGSIDVVYNDKVIKSFKDGIIEMSSSLFNSKL